MAQSQLQFHTQPIQETVRQLDAQLAMGLTQHQVQQRLNEHGENALPEAKKMPLWRLFVAQFQDFVVLLLIAAVVVSFALGDRLEAIAILSIVLLNAIIGLIQEQRADAAMAELQKLSAPEAQVLRDGVRQTVPARELVPGDIVFLEAGNYVPADMQLIESANLRMNESALTGESEAAEKQAEATISSEAPIGDRVNMAFGGTLVAHGRGRGIVTATGLHTEMGLIARMMAAIEEEATPLQRRLNQLGKTLSLAALGLCGLVFLIELARNTDLSLIATAGLAAYARAEAAAINEFFVLAVSLAVAAVPEGLAAIVTINLAIGMREMVKQHALIRRLHAVETLGSTTVICSDKTGTLTQNAMAVTAAFAGGQMVRVTGERNTPSGEFIPTSGELSGDCPNEALTLLLRGALLCSDAILEKYDGHYRIVGDATEGALVLAAAKANLWREEVERVYPRTDELAFDSVRKMMTTIHAMHDAAPDTDRAVIFTKGAPDEVLLRCTSYVDSAGQTQPLCAEQREHFQALNAEMGAQALRVLAVATRCTRASEIANRKLVLSTVEGSKIENALAFVGLLGMMDPLRREVPAAIQTAREAGIRTVMITGDYPITAQAIAVQIGLTEEIRDWRLESCLQSPISNLQSLISGPQIEAMDDDALAERAKAASVFARVSPEHKVRIVSAFKRNGHVVAMTGDGVNDAPALKRADIGIAMGITGTDVSKETADMVLTDDNFASIVRAVAQGRVVYANIRKFVYFLLCGNLAEIAVVLLTTLVGLKSPLTAIQLLWLNLMTDGAPALALGLEQGEPDVMRQPPRPAHEPILTRQLLGRMALQAAVMALVVLGVYAWALQHHPAQANTMAFVTLSLSQLPLAYSARSERFSVFRIGLFTNRKMQWAVLLSLAGMLAVVYVPFLNPIFGTLPLGLAQWAWVLPAALVPAAVAEGMKMAARAVTRPSGY